MGIRPDLRQVHIGYFRHAEIDRRGEFGMYKLLFMISVWIAPAVLVLAVGLRAILRAKAVNRASRSWRRLGTPASEKPQGREAA
jgi:hypothetical protein